MPMSWNNGSQLTIIDAPGTISARSRIAFRLFQALACEMRTALGAAVDPDVSCSSSVESSSTATASVSSSPSAVSSAAWCTPMPAARSRASNDANCSPSRT